MATWSGPPPMAPTFFWTFLALTCGYALWRGSAEARLTAIVCISASVVSTLVLSPLATRYAGLEGGEMVVDGIVLAAFTMVALRSERFWPLWIAGLQLTSGIGHAFKAVDLSMLPQAYAAATKFWSYPILLILAFGAWRNHQRTRRGEADTAYPS